MARPPSGFLGRVLRAARGSAGLSQRALARRTRVPPTSIAAVECGDRDMPLSRYAWLLQACGWQLVVTDGTGALVVDPDDDPRRDAARRRYPAHVDLRSTVPWGSWWADRWGYYWDRLTGGGADQRR